MYDCFTFDPIGITFTKKIKYSPLRDIQTHREQCQTQHYYIKIVILFTQKSVQYFPTKLRGLRSVNDF